MVKMYRKILIPLDGSELAECSLEHAKAIAQGCNVADVIKQDVICDSIFPLRCKEGMRPFMSLS